MSKYLAVSLFVAELFLSGVGSAQGSLRRVICCSVSLILFFLVVLMISVFSLNSEMSATILLLVFEGVVVGANNMSVVVVGVLLGEIYTVVVAVVVVVEVVVVVTAGSLPLPPVMFESLLLNLAKTIGFILLLILLSGEEPTSKLPLFVLPILLTTNRESVRLISGGRGWGNMGLVGVGNEVDNEGGEGVDEDDNDNVEVFTVASVNLIQSKLTINNINNIMVVITRIKLVTSFLPLKLEITLVVIVSRFYGQ